MKIGKKMAELRQARNLTQKELAKEARISISYLSKIESGYYPNPHIKILAMIASALGVTIEDLVGDYMD